MRQGNKMPKYQFVTEIKYLGIDAQGNQMPK